jgi:hypothetical protein
MMGGSQVTLSQLVIFYHKAIGSSGFSESSPSLSSDPSWDKFAESGARCMRLASRISLQLSGFSLFVGQLASNSSRLAVTGTGLFGSVAGQAADK